MITEQSKGWKCPTVVLWLPYAVRHCTMHFTSVYLGWKQYLWRRAPSEGYPKLTSVLEWLTEERTARVFGILTEASGL